MGDLIKITDLTKKTGLSSRTLRYYEQIGLIQSVRPQFEAYRYYDEAAVGRLQQIMILRKMKIAVKDIIRIYESNEMSDLVEVFCQKIEDLDNEILALSELKNIINTFMQKMIENGIKSITAMPLLYEEMENQFQLMEEQKTVAYADLESVSQKLEKPLDISIVSLPGMRVISSCLKNSSGVSDIHGFWRFIQLEGLDLGAPGNHEKFEFQTNSGEVAILRIADDYPNNSVYSDFVFPGGLYAAVNAYADEDLSWKLQMLIQSFDENSFYQVDYHNSGELRHPVLIEDMISPDDKRNLLCIYLPVKKRMANAALFDEPEELSPDSISVAEIEENNPILWKKEIPLNAITPVNGPHYRVTGNGEAEYVGWIPVCVLSTNVSVKLPYRIDIDFRLEELKGFGYGCDEGSIIVYRGDDYVYRSLSDEYLGINMNNHAPDPDDPVRQEAIEFRQPIFLNQFQFPGRGKVKYHEVNHLTWIIGEKHLAVILNGEIRYCGIHFPYMSLDLSRDEPKNIYIGSNGQSMKYFQSVSVSQLECQQKNRLEKKEFVIMKQSNNTIPNFHRLVSPESGENFWFNGCARLVMECLGETDFDYNFFAGISGDSFTQHYPKKEYMGNSVTEYLLYGPLSLHDSGDRFTFCEGENRHVENLFEKCGYASTFITNKMLKKNTEVYLNTLLSYIDKGIPVIFAGLGEPCMGTFVGYEEYGNRLLYLTGNNDKLQSIRIDKALEVPDPSWRERFGWLFVGEKKQTRPLADLYREAILRLPKLLVSESDEFFLGAEAFRAWAKDIENGKFDTVKPEEFDPLLSYSTYVGTLATIGSCYHAFLEKAQQLNPDMKFLTEVGQLYEQYVKMWNSSGNGDDLEALGGGFNITLGVLQDRQRREKIVTKLRQFADVTDEIVRVLNNGIHSL